MRQSEGIAVLLPDGSLMIADSFPIPARGPSCKEPTKTASAVNMSIAKPVKRPQKVIGMDAEKKSLGVKDCTDWRVP